MGVRLRAAAALIGGGQARGWAAAGARRGRRELGRGSVAMRAVVGAACAHTGMARGAVGRAGARTLRKKEAESGGFAQPNAGDRSARFTEAGVEATRRR